MFCLTRLTAARLTPEASGHGGLSSSSATDRGCEQHVLVHLSGKRILSELRFWSTSSPLPVKRKTLKALCSALSASIFSIRWQNFFDALPTTWSSSSTRMHSSESSSRSCSPSYAFWLLADNVVGLLLAAIPLLPSPPPLARMEAAIPKGNGDDGVLLMEENPALFAHIPAFATGAGRSAEVEGMPWSRLLPITADVPGTNAAAPPPAALPKALPLPAATRLAPAPRLPVAMPPLTIESSAIAAESRSKGKTCFCPMYLFPRVYSQLVDLRAQILLIALAISTTPAAISSPAQGGNRGQSRRPPGALVWKFCFWEPTTCRK